MGLKDCIRASDDASKLPLHGAALRTARAIGSNAGAGTGPVRGGLPSRGKKVVLGGSAKASSVEDAQKLLQKSKPKAHSRGGVGSKKRVRFEIRAERREQSESKRGVQWKDLVTMAQVQRGLVADQGAAPCDAARARGTGVGAGRAGARRPGNAAADRDYGPRVAFHIHGDVGCVGGERARACRSSHVSHDRV